ncbi:tudor domain-containing protein 15-like isoform X1 [Gadus chalcogrammus]|uniref:tudor domain-containing protein 15-like isoform X1 n=2 Tax=Gadus chalcogrammus TaxID=1042646 RepID=UPI0024C350C7|nr:tudor domain-containing protein 15-like isoform X1 [Gadus chalcogrammus]XP_056449796.1 tudor domain-containing protein 15-like isoform X1 [Gadus chalcogrammus]XP_056449797.1 tudor domain-containing protein 15-like isoform X1 [Gadus chalcogrammus]
MEEIRKWEDEERAKQQEEEERARREADQKQQMEDIRKREDEERAKQEEEERARREADQKASTGSAAVMPGLDYISPRSPDSATSALCSQWPINLKLTHLELNKETPLIQFQGHYLNMSQLDYRILQAEIQNTPKTKASVGLGEFCLVEDVMAGLWYRGEVRNANADTFDVFLIDQGNVMSVDISQMYSCSNELLDLPPKIVCGYFSNVLPLHDCWDSVMEKYLLSLIGTHVTGYIHALLPHKVMLFEATDINKELAGRGFCKHLDADTFLLLVKMLTDVPLEQNMERGPDFYQRPWVQSDFKSFGGTDMSAGTCVQLKVTAAVNPGLFHCQVSSAASDLQAMSERLTLACNSTLSDPNRTPKDNIGLLCSVKGKDGKWYRGCLQCLPVNSNVKVLFVDYGFCESVRVENILRLPANCFSLPIMAFPCTLSSVTEQDKDCKLRQLCLLKKGILNGVLNAKVLSLDVKLNTYSIEVLSNEDCFVKEPELTQEQSLRLSVQAEVLKPGSKSVGYVVHVIDPNDFSLRTEKRNGDFEDLMSQMSEHFSQVKLNEQVLKNPQIGKMCCAMYERDMHFYRAVVKQKLDHGAVVLFIDFGNTENVPYMLIKKIPEKFASQAAFALSCTLCNIMPLTDVWTSANIQFFKQTVLNKSLMVHVVHQSKYQIVVDLFTMEGQSDQGITDLLISCKQAEPWRYTQSESVKQVTTSWRPCKPKELCTWTQRQDVVPRDEKTVVSQFKTMPVCALTLFNGDLHNNIKVNEHIDNPSPKTTQCQQQDIRVLPTLNTTHSQHQDKRVSPSLDTSHSQQQDKRVLPTLNATQCQQQDQRVSPTLNPTQCQRQDKSVSPTLNPTQCQQQDKRVLPTLNTTQCQQQDKRVLPTLNATQCQQQDKSVSPTLNPTQCQQQDKSVSPTLNPTQCQQQDKRVSPTLNPTQCQQQDKRVSPTLNTTQCQQQDKSVSPTLNTTQCQQLDKRVLPIGLIAMQTKTTKLRPCKPEELCTWTQRQDVVPRDEKTVVSQMKNMPVCALTQNITPKPQVPSAFPVSFSYSSFNLGCGNKEHVYITHISDEWEIYCQLDKNSEIIEELETKISEEEEKLHGADATAPVDGMCLAKYIDGRWYRGLANPVQSSLYLNVFFVDYGNTSIVEKINVLSIPNHSAELLYTPMQAVKCTLAGVPKSEPLAWVTQWLKKTLLNELVRAVVVGKLKDGSLTVELFNGDLHINNKVNEHIDNPSPKTTHGQHQDKRVSPALDASHSQHQDKRVSPPLNTTHSQQQDKRGSPTLNTTYSKPREKKVSPTINATKATQIPKMPTLSSFPETRLKPGQQALRYVSHINTVSDYFLQLQDEKTNLLNMREVLNSSVSRASLIKSTRRELEMKNNVLAEYDDDRALYRAVIKGSEQHGFKVEITTNFKDEQARLGSRQLYFAPTNMGQVYYGFAAAVISPFDFYIVREDSLLIMNEVSAMLDELPDEMPPLPEAHRVPGSCCLVYSNTKGRWCRAEVVHAETTVVINLVDYGHYIHLASYQVKVLPEALKRPPKVTYPCSLRGVSPVSDTGQWTDKAAVFFQERVCHKDLQIVFREFVSDDRQWQVDILVDGIHLAKELVKAGHSSYSDPLLGLRYETERLGSVSPPRASRMEDIGHEVHGHNLSLPVLGIYYSFFLCSNVCSRLVQNVNQSGFSP